jgi:lauroyl/myristoyl acyltransferase
MANPAIDKLVTAMREQATALWDAQNAAEVLVEEFNAKGLSGAITNEDINGENYDVTAQNVSDFIGSVAAITTLFGAGHATNLSKMIKR